MPTNTPHGWPYPDPDDPVADYPAAVGQVLAQKLDDGPIETDGIIRASVQTASEISIGDVGGLPCVLFGASHVAKIYATPAGLVGTDSDIQAAGMWVHRHPYGARRHIESGRIGPVGLATGQVYGLGVTYVVPYPAGPKVGVAAYNLTDPTGGNSPGGVPASAWLAGFNGTGAQMYMRNNSNSNPADISADFIAEGADN